MAHSHKPDGPGGPNGRHDDSYHSVASQNAGARHGKPDSFRKIVAGKDDVSYSVPVESDTLLTEIDGRIRRDVRKGRLIMLSSTVGFSIMSILERLAQTRYGLPTPPALMIRGSVQAIFALVALPVMTDPRAQLSLPARTKWLLALRGAIGAIAVVLHITSLRYIPAGDAIAIFFTSPIFTMLFARLILKEPISSVHILAAVLSLTGGIIVTSPATDGTILTVPAKDRLIGSACAGTAAVFSSLVYIILRSLGTGIHYMSSVLSLGVGVTTVSVLAGGVFNPFNLAGDEVPGVLTMLLATLFAFTGQMGINRGIQLCPAGPGALIRNIDVPMVYLLAVIFLQEIPTMLRAFGSLLVVSSALLIALRKEN